MEENNINSTNINTDNFGSENNTNNDNTPNKKHNTKLIITIVVALVVVIVGTILLIKLLYNDDTQIEQPKPTLKDLVDVTQDTLSDGKLLIFGATNKNEVNVEVVFSVDFYDSNNELIENDEYTMYVLPSNKTHFVEVYTGNLPKQYDTFKYTYDVKESTNLKIYGHEEVVIEDEIKDNKLHLKIINNSGELVESVAIDIVYYKNNKMVKYTNAAMLGIEDGSFREGNYITNKDYFDNDIEFDNYKIFYTPVTAINKPETTTE